MRQPGLAARTIAGMSALALSVVGFVAVPGTASAAPLQTPPTVEVAIVWTGGAPQAVVTWSGATARRSITGYELQFGVGASVADVDDWIFDASCDEGALTGTSDVCHLVASLDVDTEYTVGVRAVDSADSGVQGYGSAHVPATDPDAAPEPTPSDSPTTDQPTPEPSDTTPADPPTTDPTGGAPSGTPSGDTPPGGTPSTDTSPTATAPADVPSATPSDTPTDVPTDIPSDDADAAPAVPDGLVARATGPAGIALEWDEVGSGAVSHYSVAVGPTADGPWTEAATPADASTTLLELAPRTTYYVQVSACTAQDVCSAPSSAASATTDGRAPVDDTVTAYDGYEQPLDVLRNDPDDPSTATLVDAPTAGRVVFDRGLFHYTVTDHEAVSDSFTYRDDVSQETATVTVRIDPVVLPSDPQDLHYTRPDDTHVTLTWDPPANALDTTFGLGEYVVVLCPLGDGAQDCTGAASQYVAATSATFEVDPARSFYAYVYPRDSRGGGWSDARILVAPTAGDDTGTVYDHGAWRIDVLDNDAQDPTSASVVDPPSYGSVEFRDGAFYYTASTSGRGSDSFTYRNDVSEALATVTVDIEPALGPTFASDLGLVPGTTSVTVSWDPATKGTADLAGYRVLYSTVGGSWQPYADTHDATVAGVEVTGLEPGTDYQFSVVAYDAAGLYQARTSVWTTTLHETPRLDDPGAAPEAPTDLAVVDPTDTTVHVTWSASVEHTAEVDHYTVTAHPATGDDVVRSTDDATDELVVTGLRPATTYAVTVTANDTEGRESGQSASVDATTTYRLPGAVTGVTATDATTTTLDISWTSAPAGSYPIGGYVVVRTTDPEQDDWDLVGTTTGTTLRAVDLQPGTTYYFLVLAVDSQENISLWGCESLECLRPAIGSGTTLPAEAQPPGAPVDVRLGDGTTSTLVASWTAPAPTTSAIDHYRVLMRRSGSGDYAEAGTTSSTTYTLTGLDPGTAYDVVLVAVDTEGRESDSSDVATGTTDPEPRVAPIDPLVSAPDAIVSGGTATVTVSHVSDAAVVEAGDLGDGVAQVTVDGRTARIRVGVDVSGLVDTPLLVTDGPQQVTVVAHLTVDPRPVGRATYAVVSAGSSRVSWARADGAGAYAVSVAGRSVCTTSSLTCVVPALLGPASLVRVVALGEDGTRSTSVLATFASHPVMLARVHFLGDSPVMTGASIVALRAVAARLAAAGITRITVHGYTATLGSRTRTAVQVRLSSMRARATAAALVALLRARGVAATVTVVADGASHPVASNATGSGRAENRRAEITIG